MTNFAFKNPEFWSFTFEDTPKYVYNFWKTELVNDFS